MEVRLARGNFTDGDWRAIAPRLNYLQNRNTPVSKEDKDSLDFLLPYFKEHKSFVHPVILEENPQGTFRVLDANHRLATYFYLRDDFGSEREEDKGYQVPEKLTAWVAMFG